MPKPSQPLPSEPVHLDTVTVAPFTVRNYTGVVGGERPQVPPGFVEHPPINRLCLAIGMCLVNNELTLPNAVLVPPTEPDARASDLMFSGKDPSDRPPLFGSLNRYSPRQPGYDITYTGLIPEEAFDVEQTIFVNPANIDVALARGYHISDATVERILASHELIRELFEGLGPDGSRRRIAGIVDGYFRSKHTGEGTFRQTALRHVVEAVCGRLVQKDTFGRSVTKGSPPFLRKEKDKPAEPTGGRPAVLYSVNRTLLP